MSQQAFCHHFLSEWIDSSHDGRLTPVQKGILGENIVYHLLVGIKDATELLSTDPVFLGTPIVELQVTGNAPDMLLRGQNHDYLLEVKNWFPRIGQNLNSWNRWGFNLRNYTNFRQDFLHKTWDAGKWRVRSVSGKHSSKTVSIRDNCIYYKMGVLSYPLYNEDTLLRLGSFFKDNIAFGMHAFTGEDPCEKIGQRYYKLGKQLELIIKRNEDGKA